MRTWMSLSPSLCISLLSVSLWLIPVVANGQDKGDTVIVIRETAIRNSEKVLQPLHPGKDLKVRDVKGDLIWVSSEATGWVSKKDVCSLGKAIDLFTEQIEKSPKDAGLYVARGIVWRAKGEIDIAIGDYDEAIKLDPARFDAYADRARCWSDKREIDKAIDDYTEGIRLDPNNAIVYNNRGSAWNRKGEFDRAIPDLTAAIKLSPTFARAYSNRGWAWWKTRQYDRAVADLSEVIRLDPQASDAFRIRAGAFEALKQYEKALDDYSTAVRLNPHDVEAYRARAAIWKTKEQYEKAIKDFAAAVRIEPGDLRSCNSLAMLYATCPEAQFRDGSKAVENAKKACEISGWKNEAILDTLASAYAEAGDFEAAIKWQSRALDLAARDDRDEYQSRLDLYKSGRPYRDYTRK